MSSRLHPNGLVLSDGRGGKRGISLFGYEIKRNEWQRSAMAKSLWFVEEALFMAKYFLLYASLRMRKF